MHPYEKQFPCILAARITIMVELTKRAQSAIPRDFPEGRKARQKR